MKRNFIADTHDFKRPVSLTDIEDLEDELCEKPTANGCTEEFTELCICLAGESELPRNWQEALDLYSFLCEELDVEWNL